MAVKVFERELRCIVEVADPGWEDPSQAFMALVALELISPGCGVSSTNTLAHCRHISPTS